jgi:hypothetical protein
MTNGEILAQAIKRAKNNHGAIPISGREVVAAYNDNKLPHDVEGLLFVIGYLVDETATLHRLLRYVQS